MKVRCSVLLKNFRLGILEVELHSVENGHLKVHVHRVNWSMVNDNFSNYSSLDLRVVNHINFKYFVHVSRSNSFTVAIHNLLFYEACFNPKFTYKCSQGKLYLIENRYPMFINSHLKWTFTQKYVTIESILIINYKIYIAFFEFGCKGVINSHIF